MFYKYTSGFVWLDHWYCNCGIDVEVALWSFHGFLISSPFEAAVGCLSSVKITILFSELNVVFFGISYFSFSVTGIFHCWWQMPSPWILRTHWWCQGCGQGCGSLLEGWRKYSQVRIESGWLVVEENAGGLRTLAELLQLGSGMSLLLTSAVARHVAMTWSMESMGAEHSWQAGWMMPGWSAESLSLVM